MSASVAVHVLVEVHHLKAIELVRDILDGLSLIAWDRLYTRGIPSKRQSVHPDLRPRPRRGLPLDVVMSVVFGPVLRKLVFSLPLLAFSGSVSNWARHCGRNCEVDFFSQESE